MLPKMRTTVALLVVLLAGQVYRMKRAVRNIFVSPPLPEVFSPFKRCDIATAEVQGLSPRFCEDGVLWEINGLNRLILSCDPGRKSWNTVMGPLKYPEPHGRIWLYNPSESSSKFEPLTMENFSKDGYFHPLGIDVFVDPQTSESRLAAVNHGKERTTVEIFALNEEGGSAKLTHLHTISSPWFRAPNAVRFTSANSFYITQDHFFTRRLPWPLAPFLPLFETYLGIPAGVVNNVQFTDSGSEPQFTITWSALGIPFANGMAISPDGMEVTVASSNMNALYLYDRDPATQSLKYRESLEMPFATDNVDYTHMGEIIATGHPHFPALVSVAWNGTKFTQAPSWVLEVSRVGPGKKGKEEKAPYSAYERASMPDGYSMRTLYQSDGSHFQSSTTGVWDSMSNSLYVTGLYQDGILICRE